MSDSKSERFLDRYLGARVPGHPSREDVLAALREHVSLTAMLGYERDDDAMTVLYKGVLVEASRDPGTWEKADRFALVTQPAANFWHLPPACSPSGTERTRTRHRESGKLPSRWRCCRRCH